MTAKRHCGHDTVAQIAFRYPVATFDNRARRLIANDMRVGNERAAGPVEGVASLNADGFNLDEHATTTNDGVGQFDVFQDVG